LRRKLPQNRQQNKLKEMENLREVKTVARKMNLKLHQKRKTKNHNTIVMETSSKRKKKSQRRKLLPQRLDQDTSISHGLRPTTKREAHMQSTKLSKKSKMKF
jgi:hypothetical protein